MPFSHEEPQKVEFFRVGTSGDEKVRSEESRGRDKILKLIDISTFMKLSEFTPNIARDVMKIWIDYFGSVTSVNQRYVDNPEVLSRDVRNPRYWFGGCYSYRMGSKWTNDSKLLVHFNNHQRTLEVECYMQSQSLWGEQRKEAEIAEIKFNNAIKKYLMQFETRTS